MFLFLCDEAEMFLIFLKSEPQCSYKHGPYKKKCNAPLDIFVCVCAWVAVKRDVGGHRF